MRSISRYVGKWLIHYTVLVSTWYLLTLQEPDQTENVYMLQF